MTLRPRIHTHGNCLNSTGSLNWVLAEQPFTDLQLLINQTITLMQTEVIVFG